MLGRGLALTGALLASASAMAQQGIDPDLRAAATEARMTDEERFQLLSGLMPLPVPGRPFDRERFAGVPAVSGYIKGIGRLGIPALVEADAGLGIANPLQVRDDYATALPSGLAIASTFDPQIAYAGGAMIGAEARSLGFNVLLGGSMNLARDPRNGRNFEYLGEDPLLAGTMAGETIRGTQDQNVISTVKHFSLNAQETLRSSLDALIDEAGHRESDLLAFEIAIERGRPGAVMCGYNLVNGHYACGNDHLLNEVLKRDWGYKGWVMSDWGAVHDVSYFNAGLDQQSGAQLDKQIWFDAPLKAQYAAGHVSRARLSDAVRRILRSIYAIGADRATTKPSIDREAHAQVARRAATEGMVLLKNDGILPLAGRVRSIAVVGGHAHVGVLSGGGSSQVVPEGGPAAVIPMGGPAFLGTFGRQFYLPSSPLKALRAALPDTTSMVYDSGYAPEVAAARAAKADMVIVFVTQWQIESTDAGMELPEGQDALIAALAKANPNVVVVLETGNPVLMPWLGDVRAVVQSWYSGSRGGEAIADILTGKANPSGRLPLTWPRDIGQTPRPVAVPGLGEPDGTRIQVRYSEGSDVGYRWFSARNEKPLFPFGFGLSYTRFDYSDLKLSRVGQVTARFRVRNTGDRAGGDVPQLYLVSAAGKAMKRLVAFQKVRLKPGESRTVTVRIDPRLLAHWDTTAGNWRLDAGRYDFALGTSANDLRQRGSIAVEAIRLKP